MRNFFGKLGEKFRTFMQGRYGNDNLGRFTIALALVLMIAYLITKLYPLYIIELALLIISIFRSFSRNVEKRYAENQKYLRIKGKIKNWFKNIGKPKTDLQHKIYHCPSCKQKVRVPKGKGRIAITCPKCSTQFIKKT